VAGSVVLNTAIGLFFVFLTASLICTGVLEYISKRLNKRGDYLLRGLREMLDIPPATPGASSPEPVPPPAPLGLLEEGKTRDKLNRLSTECLGLGAELKRADPASYRPSAPLADLVLAHPVIATLHRPSRPGTPVPATAARPEQPETRRREGVIARVRSRFSGRRDEMHLASYISGRTFAGALIDLVGPDEADKADLRRFRESVEKLDKTIPARSALLAIIRDARGDIDRLRSGIEQWYDEQMARVSGWYKRWAQWRLFLAGAILAVVANVHALDIAHALYRDEPVRQAVVAKALPAEGCPAEGPERESCLAAQRTILEDLPLPLGWDIEGAMADCAAYHGGNSCLRRPWLSVPVLADALRDTGLVGVILTLLGWLTTAAAVSFGAPFWFDALNRLGSLRTAGRRPVEPNSGGSEGSEATVRASP
jgi:hypothetical protein